MRYTAKERERYNEDRERACKRLGITVNQYNWLRRKGEELHKIYEDNCNGLLHEVEYNIRTGRIEQAVEDYIGRLHVYFQTDPRGATIYLDKNEIPRNNYTQAVCIY